MVLHTITQAQKLYAYNKVCFRGTSLIELLVVMAIICVLAALLLPAIQVAKRTTRIAVCAANLRQVGMWGMAYAQDWQGRLPGNTGDYPTNPFRGWYERVREDLDLPSSGYHAVTTNNAKVIGRPYLLGTILSCPAAAVTFGINRYYAKADYMINRRLGKPMTGPPLDPTPRLSMLTAQTFWFTDMVRSNLLSDGRWETANTSWSEDWDLSLGWMGEAQIPWPWTSIGRAHGQVTNVLYGDGRVGALRYVEYLGLGPVNSPRRKAFHAEP